MTEYWVSQGNKWCDYCKIFIANNATSIRTHEFGTRHKENVAKRVAAMRKDTVSKEKEKQQAIKDLTKIEAQALKSYEKDLAAIKNADKRRGASLQSAQRGAPSRPPAKGMHSYDWTYDSSTGYHYHADTTLFYDSSSGLYYSDALGKWSTQEEALKATQEEDDIGPAMPTGSRSTSSTLGPASKKSVTANSSSNKKQTTESVGPSPEFSIPSRVVVRGVASSLAVGKRKREYKPGRKSSEEAAALAARDAARRRTEEREKALLGLYQAY
eukprot:TRINITY_DN14062_c0_g1_i1.p1 TRINITY_DN14062_c0_g1~~TRINITY_DN14062_c0_g1_i1.p1  ORF type:complete len:270 (-),score=41.13 TRINITY_DN14062_c0_g1_i1:257-1066(-)